MYHLKLVHLLSFLQLVTANDKFFFMMTNHRLDMLVFDVKSAMCGPASCAALCESDPNCLSASVQKETGECHMTNTTVLPGTGLLLEDPAWDYYFDPGE